MLALNVNNGSTIWSDHMPDFSGDDDIPTAAAYDAGNLYVGSKNGIEYEVSASNGAIEWQYNTGSDGDFGIYSSAAVTGGTVFFGGGDRRLHAVNESTGARSSGPPRSAGVSSSRRRRWRTACCTSRGPLVRSMPSIIRATARCSGHNS